MTAFGLVLVVVVTLACFGIDPLRGLSLIAEGAFGDKFGIARTLVRTSPLLLCGLGMAVAWKCGMYNVGGEGQYVLGGLMGALAAKVALAAQMPTPLLHIGVVALAVGGGAALAAFAGWLQVARGVQAVISTILLNFVALQLLAFSVRGPLQEPKKQLPLTQSLSRDSMFLRFDPQTDLHAGLVVGLVCGALVIVVLARHVFGFRLRLVGANPEMARLNGVDPGRTQIVAMGVSGGLCGLAAALDYLGFIGQIGDGFSQNWGFLAIPVALLGGLDGLGVALSALFFGALMAGGEGLSRFDSAGTPLVAVIQAVAVLFVVALSARRRRQVTDD